MIRLRQVSKHFAGATAPAVDRLDLHVAPGELLVLLGESGCGKTTTLRLMNRLLEPDTGVIEVHGADVRGQDPVALRRSMGYVIQGIGLFPHLTVTENVAVVPRLLGWSPARIRERVEELLALVGLSAEEHGPRRPAALSGGQRQRVGLARALAARPPVLLMDEPLGALDPLTRDTLQQEVRRLHDRLGLTTVLVTHDMAEALLLADRIVVMQGGSVRGAGTPRELLARPPHPYIRRLMATPRRQAARLEELAGCGEGGRGAEGP